MVSLGVDNEGSGSWLNPALKKNAAKTSPFNPVIFGQGKPKVSPIITGQQEKGSFFNPAFKAFSSSKQGSDTPRSSGIGSTGMGKRTGTLQRPEEESDLERLISELLNQTNEGHTWESRAQDEDMINQIFGSQLSALANARDTATSRHGTSLANTKELYGGHVHDIRNADKATYQGIATDQAAATNQVYDTGVKQLEDSRNANRDAGTEMLQRLGLQASAPLVQETANEGQSAIDSLVQAKASQQNQNTAYAGADMRRNDERAQSIADESVAQQTDLTRQLEDILGSLSNKEADVNSQKSEALYGAFRDSKNDWRTDREYATNSLAQLLKAQSEAAGKEQELQQTNAPQMANILAGLGINDPSLQKDYSSAYTDAVLNANYVPGIQDQTTAYLKYLTQNNERGLDPNVLQQLITGNLNYGSYKLGAPTS